MFRESAEATEPICFNCERPASAIPEYRALGFEEKTSPGIEAARDGTYNSLTNRFCCTECYISIGMPTLPSGWKAP